MQDDSGYRKRAQELGPHVDEMILKLLARGEGFIDTRKIWGILSLDKRYTASQIDAACGRALDLGSVGFRVVKSFLEREEMAAMVRSQPEGHRVTSPLPARATGHKHVRPLSVYREQMNLFVPGDAAKSIAPEGHA